MFESNFWSKILNLFVIISSFGVFFYILFSINEILKDSVNLIEISLNLIILFFELITAIYGIFLLFHNSLVLKPSEKYELRDVVGDKPGVTIIIPTFNPDLYAIETNFLLLKKNRYKNINIIVTDNSNDPFILKGLEKICLSFNINFFHREGIFGFKARNLNNILSHIKTKYFVIIDIDQTLTIDGIEKFVSHFENNLTEDYAFIQAKFRIMNADSIIRNSIAILYTFFYDIVSYAKNKRQTVLFNGSSACFKTDIVKKIGGFSEDCYTEDMALAYKLLINGYKSSYLNEYVTTALVPWKLSQLLSSFWRWTHGGTALLIIYWKDILKSKFLSKGKKVELFINTLSFIAFSGVIIITFSMLLIYFGGFKIYRPVIILNTIVIPIIAIFPIILTGNHVFSCILGILESNTYKRLIYLIPYGIASLSLAYFIFQPTYYALLKIKGPKKSESVWNREIKLSPILLGLSIVTMVLFITSVDAFLNNNELSIIFFLMSLGSFGPIIFLLFDRNIDINNKNQKYFESVRKLNNL